MKGKRVNFICFNKVYPVELSIFNKHSNFFSESKEIYEQEGTFELLSSYDLCTSHTKESIETFLNYCQDGKITIEVSNVVSIEFLSRKYFVEELSKMTKQFIEEHSKEIIEYFLSNKDIKSPKYEELVSTHFTEYSTDDRLYRLPISTLYRIEQRFIREMKKEEKEEDNEETNSKRIKTRSRTIIDFLIKTVINIGEESSIFITSYKFNQKEIIYLNERIDNIEDYDSKEILITFLQKNASFIIETRIKEKEEKTKYEKRIKRLEDKISLLYCNVDLNKPINLPNSSNIISQQEFEGYPFKEITLPNNIKIIGSESFKECLSLTKITLSATVKTIESKAFKGCSSLKEIQIPQSVTTICESSFEGCSSLTKINIPTKITIINSKSFKGCSSLKEIQIPQSVTTICESSFKGCSSLTKINIPTKITIINSKSFKGCLSLKEIQIPQSVTTICESSFEWCTLKQITIPSSVTQIGKSAFFHCSSLTQITIPSSVTQIGDGAFSHCSSLTQITIPSTVTQIGNYVFSSCSSLAQITIPSSVTQIGKGVFSFCESLTQITIQQNHESRLKYLENGLLIYKSSKDGDYDTVVWMKKNIKTIDIPSSIKIIKGYAFEKCSSLTQITIPSSVTQIGNYAFDFCSSLTQITIPSSVTQIGNNAFSSCFSLTQITIPKSLDISSIGIENNVKVIRV